MTHGRCGFSLIELLVAIGIISILLGLTAPAMSRARRHAQAVKCRDQLRQIGVALVAYASGRESALFPDGRRQGPRVPTWPELLFGERYPAVMRCPNSRESGEPSSYQINSWLRFSGIQSVKRNGVPPSRVVLIGEAKPGIADAYSSMDELFPSLLTMDPARHGPKLLSNYLWLDLHVSNEIPVSPVGSLNPWKPY